MAVRTARGVRFRPMNVFVQPDSPAGETYRARRNAPGVRRLLAEEIAPGFVADPSLDLRYFGGKTLPMLAYTNFYVGGESAWDSDDIHRINDGLAAAMTDPELNDVLAQYFPGEQVSARFDGSRILPDPAPSTVYKDTVEHWVADLYLGGLLSGFDPTLTVFDLLLPAGVVLVDGTSTGADDDADSGAARLERESDDSLNGLGGYHGSIHVAGSNGGAVTLYYAVGVYSEETADGTNGIVAFDEPWKNVVATFYHELQEVRTDADVEDAIRAGDAEDATKFLGWMSLRDGEIGDIPMEEAGPNLSLVMKEVPLPGGGTVPIQLMWSNAMHGPEGPRQGQPQPAPAPTQPTPLPAAIDGAELAALVNAYTIDPGPPRTITVPNASKLAPLRDVTVSGRLLPKQRVILDPQTNERTVKATGTYQIQAGDGDLHFDLGGTAGDPHIACELQNATAWLSTFRQAVNEEINVGGFFRCMFEHPGFRQNDDAHIFEIHPVRSVTIGGTVQSFDVDVPDQDSIHTWIQPHRLEIQDSRIQVTYDKATDTLMFTGVDGQDENYVSVPGTISNVDLAARSAEPASFTLDSPDIGHTVQVFALKGTRAATQLASLTGDSITLIGLRNIDLQEARQARYVINLLAIDIQQA